MSLMNFILSYELYGIRWNLFVVARDWIEAKSKAPRGAKNVNAELIP